MTPSNNKAGFTIIETMLVLGVSALLIIGVLIGVGTSINIQRYRDSVNSLQSFIQQQYSEVTNAINDSPVNSCGNRGQSECVILGRYITTSNSGKNLVVKRVIGQIPSAPTAINDIASIQEYMGGYSVQQVETYSIEWDSAIINNAANGGGPMSLSMLILRSPSSGVIHTFIDTSAVIADNKLKNDLVGDTALNRDAQLCVDNGAFGGSKMAVFVTMGAANASNVKILGDGSGNTC